MATQFNLRSPAVKRLMREAEELREPTIDYYAQPLDDNLFEWHFTVRGPSDSDFEAGIYHGRIILPSEYPMKPPSIILLTPNGRFETNKKICLSISGHHPESWQPSWSIRTALLAIIGFMPSEGLGAIGSLDFLPEQRQKLAIKSQSWSCPSCGSIKSLLKERSEKSEPNANAEKDRELAKQICFKEGNRSSTSSNQKSDEKESSTPAETSTESATSIIEDNRGDSVPAELRQRIGPNVQDDQAEHSASSSGATTATQQQETVNTNLDSGPLLSTYLIVFLSIAIAFLLFRRLFLIE